MSKKQKLSLFIEIRLPTLKKQVNPYQILKIIISVGQPTTRAIYSNQLLSHSPTKM